LKLNSPAALRGSAARDKGAESMLRVHLSQKNWRDPDELRGPAGFAAFAKTKAE
jgi:hypothetical protein